MINNGRIYDNVHVRDVQQALGTTKHFWNELCSHPNINKWARFKPRKLSKADPITYLENMGLNTNTPFGLSIIGFQSTSQTNFVNAIKEYCRTRFCGAQNGTYKDYNQGVKYNPPTTGDCYRITDFRCAENSRLGYNRAAEPLWAEPGSNTTGMGASIPDGGVIDIGNVVQYQDLHSEENRAILAGTPIKTSLADETNLNFNSLSVPLLLRVNGVPTTDNVKRGVIITDGEVYYIAIDRIPWWDWIQTSDEGVLISDEFVHWYRFDFLTTASRVGLSSNAGWSLIPGLEGEVIFRNGGATLAFTPLDEPGYVNNNIIQIRFHLISGDLSRFSHIHVRMGEQNGVAFLEGDLESFWNSSQQYYDMDLPYEQYYDGMTLEIVVTTKVTDNSSENWKTQWRYTFTVRGN